MSMPGQHTLLPRIALLLHMHAQSAAHAFLALTETLLQDEVRVLVRCNTIYFTSGYLGHLAVWILDTIRR